MDTPPPAVLPYQRARFTTDLPLACRYSASHAWMAQVDKAQWRVGLTKFATRMLGEMVDHGFSLAPGAPVRAGQIVGWIEGFNAISDLYCIANGEFAEGNPLLQDKLSLVHTDPYGAGWLYLVKGTPDPACMDAAEYARLLDKTIDQILQKQPG